MVALIILIIFLPRIIHFIWRIWGYSESEYYQITHKSLGDLLSDKGAYGEYLIYRHLDKKIQGEHKWLFNVYLPRSSNQVTEIDAMLFHTSGIYVFESKNYKGWIFGNENQKFWTQCLRSSNHRKAIKNRFPNPMMQNQLHISCLQRELADSHIPMYSVIVFGNRSVFKQIDLTSKQHLLILLEDISVLLNHINAPTCNYHWQSAYDHLFPMTQVSEEVKRQHVSKMQNHEGTIPASNTPYDYAAPPKSSMFREVPKQNAPAMQNRMNNDINLICPRCGCKLVVRTARRGSYQGRKFMGCSNYPECRYTQNLNQ